MIPVYLSWAIVSGTTSHGGKNRSATLDDVLKVMNEITNKAGTINLEIINAHEIGTQSLQIRVEKGYFLLLLGEHDEEDHNVRTYTNTSIEQKRVDILGDFWDSRMVCTEYDVVMKVLMEFVETGDVSTNILS
jgi:hypothetical protein